MRRILLSSCMLAGTNACGVDFVELDRNEGASVAVQGAHDDSLAATVQVWHSPAAAALRVEVDGVEVEPTSEGSGPPMYTIALTVDTLRPRLDVRVETIATRTVVDIAFPLLARTGPAQCLADGDLLLPLTTDRTLFPPERSSWRIDIRDENGGSVSGQSRGILPDPLIVDGSFPTGDGRIAEVEVRFTAALDEDPFQVFWSLQSTATVTLPEACESDDG
jgi:hypothetical protein